MSPPSVLIASLLRRLFLRIIAPYLPALFVLASYPFLASLPLPASLFLHHYSPWLSIFLYLRRSRNSQAKAFGKHQTRRSITLGLRPVVGHHPAGGLLSQPPVVVLAMLCPPFWLR